MKTQVEPGFALIQWLIRLHEAHDKENNLSARGRLANLRYGLRNRLHEDYPIGRVMTAFDSSQGVLSDDDETNEWFTVVAALYGFAHDKVEHDERVSMGRALRELYTKRENESLERRFMALLNADAENLPGHLRQAISLLKTEEIGVDWHLLLNDVRRWDAPGKPVQKRWGRDYYRYRASEDEIVSNIQTTEEGE